jgi:hypothetical protein
MNKEQEKQVKDQIRLLIDTYKTESDTMSIPNLVAFRDQLVTWNATLGEVVSLRRKDSQLAHVFRKYSVAVSKNSLIKAGTAIGKADAQSIVDNKLRFDEEVEAENEAFDTDMLYRSVNKIDDAVSQRISWMKQEYTQTNR